MNDQFHPLYVLGSLAFLLGGIVIGYVVGWRRGWDDGVEDSIAAEIEILGPERSDSLIAELKELSALKGGRP